MEHELKTFIDGNVIIKKYFQYPKEELEVIRMLINLRLIYIQWDPEKRTTVRSVKICVNENYNYLDFIVSFIYKVDSYAVSTEEFLDVLKVRPVCEYCKCNKCIIEKNNNSVCTIIYGERDMLKPIISNHYKLSRLHFGRIDTNIYKSIRKK